MTPEMCAAFVKDMALPLGMRADEHYRQVGRGMLIVTWIKDPPGAFKAMYVTADEAQ